MWWNTLDIKAAYNYDSIKKVASESLATTLGFPINNDHNFSFGLQGGYATDKGITGGVELLGKTAPTFTLFGNTLPGVQYDLTGSDTINIKDGQHTVQVSYKLTFPPPPDKIPEDPTVSWNVSGTVSHNFGTLVTKAKEIFGPSFTSGEGLKIDPYFGYNQSDTPGKAEDRGFVSGINVTIKAGKVIKFGDQRFVVPSWIPDTQFGFENVGSSLPSNKDTGHYDLSLIFSHSF